MNGRVYDQLVGRFLSADPFIDGVGNTQGWNRYSYVLNNPVSYTDPSGFSTDKGKVEKCEYACPGGGSGADGGRRDGGSRQQGAWGWLSGSRTSWVRVYYPQPATQNHHSRSDGPTIHQPMPFSTMGLAGAGRARNVGDGYVTGGGYDPGGGRSGGGGSAGGGTCPGSCHTSGIAIPEVTPEVRAETKRFYQNLSEDFTPGLGLYRAATGQYLFSGDEASRLGGALASAPYFGIVLRSGVRIIPWSSRAVRAAAESLEVGATEVRVGSRSEAAELFLGRYQGAGYRNSTGMSPRDAKDYFGGKAGTYHWDIGDAAFPHGASHLQIHTFEGQVIRIYFPD